MIRTETLGQGSPGEGESVLKTAPSRLRTAVVWAWLCCSLDAHAWPTVGVGGIHTSFAAAQGSQESSKASWSAASSVNRYGS